MGIKQLYNDNLRKLPNEYGDVSVMQSSLKTFDNTGFGFGIFGCEKLYFLGFQEILKIFVFEFSAFVSLQTIWTSSTFQHRLECIH